MNKKIKNELKNDPMKWITIVVAIIVLNYATNLLMRILHVPLFLDTWATSMGVILGGLPLGMAGGVLYNILWALVENGPLHMIWAVSSLLVAFLVWEFYQKKWLSLKNPGKVFLVGALIGILNALITVIISLVFFDGGATYGPTEPLFQLFYSWFRDQTAAIFLQQLIVEIVDKTLVLFIALYFLKFFSKTPSRSRRKRIKEKHEEEVLTTSFIVAAGILCLILLFSVLG